MPKKSKNKSKEIIFIYATVMFSGLWCWLLSKVWSNESVIVCEPRTPVLIFETIGSGLISIVSLIYLIKVLKGGNK